MFDALGKNSILSFPERGKWGNARWRGNMSGHVYKALFEFFQPKTFVDPMVGSGTSIEVAMEMGIEAVGLDLHQGFDATRMSILEAVGRESDMCVSHPPYSTMISYSGNQWGDAPVPGDLSHIEDYDDFLDALQAVMLNQRDATKRNGIYGTIVGDLRHRGNYYSIQADLMNRLPRNELRSVLIKAQWNTSSGSKEYGRMKYPWVTHEYILLWEKLTGKPFAVFARLASQNDRHLKGTWRAVIRHALLRVGGKADLKTIYAVVSEGATGKIAGNPNWQAKVRQVLRGYSDFRSLDRGVYALA